MSNLEVVASQLKMCAFLDDGMNKITMTYQFNRLSLQLTTPALWSLQIPISHNKYVENDVVPGLADINLPLGTIFDVSIFICYVYLLWKV